MRKSPAATARGEEGAVRQAPDWGTINPTSFASSECAFHAESGQGGVSVIRMT